MSKPWQVQAVGAAHHWFLWIHPFLDGNGRLARLMSHVLLKRLGIGTSPWSIIRGLARDKRTYKSLLILSDSLREGDRDGWAGQSHPARSDRISRFFLAIDQVRFMAGFWSPDSGITCFNRHDFEAVTARDGVICNVQCKGNFLDFERLEADPARFAKYNAMLVRGYERALSKERRREHVLTDKLGITRIEQMLVSGFPVATNNPRMDLFSRVDQFSAVIDTLATVPPPDATKDAAPT